MMLRTVVVGVGRGSLAFYYAANVKRWGPACAVAVDSIFPTPGHVPGPLPPRIPVRPSAVQVSGDGCAGEDAAAVELRWYLALHPASHKRTQTSVHASAQSARLDSPHDCRAETF
jgi:hypothetical protein